MLPRTGSTNGRIYSLYGPPLRRTPTPPCGMPQGLKTPAHVSAQRDIVPHRKRQLEASSVSPRSQHSREASASAAALVDAAAVDAVAEARHATMVQHFLAQCFASTVQTDRGTVGRDIERSRRLPQIQSPQIHQRKDRCVIAFHAFRLADAASAGILGGFGGTGLGLRCRIDHPTLGSVFAPCVDHHIAVQAIEPCDRFFRIIEGIGSLDRSECCCLEDISSLVSTRATSNERLEISPFFAQRCSDDFALAGAFGRTHGLFIA